MAKRLHDTDCWRKQWFRHLSAENKILWLYMLDTCDCAGIWEKDLELAEFSTGIKFTEESFKALEKQYKVIDDSRLLIIDFISFQYGNITSSHKMYKPINNSLILYGYAIDTVIRKDKSNSKSKEKEKKYDTAFKMPEVAL
jgi:hypothetical protein